MAGTGRRKQPARRAAPKNGAAAPFVWGAWTLGVQWWRRFGEERPLHGTAHDALMAMPLVGRFFRTMGVLPAAEDSIATALAAGRGVARGLPPPPGRSATRHPGPIPEHDALDHLTMITPRTTTTHRLRHQRLDPSPRSLAEFS